MSVARAELFEKLSRIERSISHRAPLKEVLDSITAGARELLGDDIVSVRLIDPDDPSYTLIVSYSGLPAEAVEAARRLEIGRGASGAAIKENRLILMDPYEDSPTAVPAFVKTGVKVAMAAPVHEEGSTVGSLVVGSREPTRRYDRIEQEVLLAFAEHVSLALTDIKTVEAMREAQRAKELFLAMVSHELKTPLTVLIAALHTFKKHPSMPEDVRDRLLDSALQRGRDLERLINRLLQGSRAELAGARQEVYLHELVDDATSGFEQSRQLDIGDVPEVLLDLDTAAVRQALGILLENAVSHSPVNTSISLRCRLVSGEVHLMITNRGCLPENIDPASLFDAFQRGPETSSPGVGLGLYIAARLAETIGGRIDASSGDGKVVFTLRFPYAHKDQARGELSVSRK